MVGIIEAIRRYQTNGDREIIDRIRGYMDTDFLAYKHTGGTRFPEHEMYIAFRIMRIIGGRLGTIKYTLSDEDYEDPQKVIEGYSYEVKQALGYHITSHDNKFDMLRRNASEVRSCLGLYGYEVLMLAIHDALHKPNRREQIVSEIITALFEPLIVPALDFALRKVDINRSEREIVRYVNFAFRTQYYRQQVEAKGMVRVRRRDKEGQVKPKYVVPRSTDAHYALLGPGEQFTSSAYIHASLTELQRKFYGAAVDIVTADFISENYAGYNVDNNGLYRVINRYLARAMAKHEVTVSRTLSSIRKAVR